ncbi:MAG: hypothetical protein JW759_00495 [Candidatus Coatesbacteria bacterium]|nr:hypothetical protein [Candidatus Coatesbacteria bacterium]
MREILGAIDIGTGSVLCLAVEKTADGLGRELVNESVITALGAGTASDPSVRQKSIERTLKPVVGYVEKLRRAGATSISIVGTSALRRAPNRDEFVERVKRETGLEVEMISGEDEAQLTFWGATHALSTGTGPVMMPVVVMDVGGGSTELVFGHLGAAKTGGPTPPELAASLPIGSLILTDRFITRYPIDSIVMELLRIDIRNTLAAESVEQIITAAKRASEKPLLVAVGGSATTLVAMEHEIVPYVPAKVHRRRISRSVIIKHIERLGKMSLNERYKIAALPRGRAPVIDAGLTILDELLALSGQDFMTVSDKGLRYGVIVRDSRRGGPASMKMEG